MRSCKKSSSQTSAWRRWALKIPGCYGRRYRNASWGPPRLLWVGCANEGGDIRHKAGGNTASATPSRWGAPKILQPTLNGPSTSSPISRNSRTTSRPTVLQRRRGNELVGLVRKKMSSASKVVSEYASVVQAGFDRASDLKSQVSACYRSLIYFSMRQRSRAWGDGFPLPTNDLPTLNKATLPRRHRLRRPPASLLSHRHPGAGDRNAAASDGRAATSTLQKIASHVPTFPTTQLPLNAKKSRTARARAMEGSPWGRTARSKKAKVRREQHLLASVAVVDNELARTVQILHTPGWHRHYDRDPRVRRPRQRNTRPLDLRTRAA